MTETLDVKRKTRYKKNCDVSALSSDFCEFKGLVFVRYLDHVQYSRTSALAMAPQVRKTIGWLVYECEQYVTLSWDCDSGPPTLRGGDPKATGLVILKSDILEFKRLDDYLMLLKEDLQCILNSELVITTARVGVSNRLEAKNSRKREAESNK